MPKLDWGKVLGNLAQTAAGMQQGQIAADAELRRRQVEQQAREAQYDQFVLSQLPSLDRDTQARFTGTLAQRASNRAQGLPSENGTQPTGLNILPSPGASGPFRPGPEQARPMAPPTPTSHAAGGEAPPLLFAPSNPTLAVPNMEPGMKYLDPETRRAAGMVGPLAPTSRQPVPAPTPEPMLVGEEKPQFVYAKTGKVAAPPATAGAPAPSRPGIEFPGFGTGYRKGVDAKEAEGLRKDFGELQKWFADQRLPDQVKKDVASLFTQMPPSIETEEQRDQARRVVENLRVARVGMGRFAQTQGFAEEKQLRNDLEEEAKLLTGMNEDQLFEVLPGLWERAQGLKAGKRTLPPGNILAAGKNIEAMQMALAAGDDERARQLARVIRGQFGSALKPAEETARMNAALKLLGEMDPRSRMDPDTVRTIFRNAGVEHLIEGVGEGALRFGTQELEERWDRMVRDLPRYAGSPPARQKVFFNEMSGLARLLGRPVPLNPGDLFKLDEATAARIARDQQRFQWQKQDRTTDLAIERLRVQRARIGLESDRLKLGKLKSGKDSGLTVSQKASTLSREYDRALTDYGNYLLDNYMTEAAFDPEKPKNPLEQKASAKWQRMQAAKKNYYGFLTSNGLDPSLLEQEGQNAPEKGSGKAETGAMLGELSNPNRPENQKVRKPLEKMTPEEFQAEFARGLQRAMRRGRH